VFSDQLHKEAKSIGRSKFSSGFLFVLTYFTTSTNISIINIDLIINYDRNEANPSPLPLSYGKEIQKLDL
jgi:hypothetical protein